jgi:methionine-rich copper-binding protein CopC
MENTNVASKNPGSKKDHSIVIIVLSVLVVLLALFDARLFRQNRMNGNTNTTKTAVNNTVLTNSVNNATANTTLSNTATNNVTTNSTNTVPTNTTSNTTTPSTSGSDNISGKPVLVLSSPASDQNVAESSIASVSLTFDKALDPSSTLSVTKESLPQHVGTGTTTFSSDRKTMTLSINSSSNSKYTIHYTACTGENLNCALGVVVFTVGSGGQKNPVKESPSTN